MRGLFFVFGFMLAGAGALAQQATTFGGFSQPFTSTVDSEEVAAPARPTPTTVAPVSASALAPAVAAPFVVKGIHVVISDTAGFARDLALEKAARMGLPTALMALPMEEADAKAKAKAVGDAMRFVKGYALVKELLIPAYTLDVDMTFDEAMLRTNFGGTKVVAVSASVVASASTPEAVPSPTVVKRGQMIVRLDNPEAQAQDRVYRALVGLPNTRALYRIVTSQGAEWTVNTPADEKAVEKALNGTGAVVVGVVAPGKGDEVVSESKPAPKSNGKMILDPGVSELLGDDAEGQAE